MTRMTAKDFRPELLELYDFYAHGKITKREFLDRAAKYAAAGVTAAALLAMLSPDYVLADPPRAGMGKQVVREILRLGPPRLVIVSCDPATLARDLAALLGGATASSGSP